MIERRECERMDVVSEEEEKERRKDKGRHYGYKEEQATWRKRAVLLGIRFMQGESGRKEWL